MPRRLRAALSEHQVSTVNEQGWSGSKNGKLLSLAAEAFDVMVTVDKSLPNQQVLEGLPISVIVLRAKSNQLVDLLPLVDSLLIAIPTALPGQCIELAC